MVGIDGDNERKTLTKNHKLKEQRGEIMEGGLDFREVGSLDFEIFSIKSFLSFEREKSNFTTLPPPLEKFLPTPMGEI